MADSVASNFKCPVVIIVPSRLYNSLSPVIQTITGKRAITFPDWDILPYEHKYPSTEIVAERIFSLWKLSNESEPVILTTATALLWRTLPKSYIRRHAKEIALGDDIPPELLTDFMARIGYTNEQVVEFLNTFARRGNIVDFFSPAHTDPIRVEFFGDEIDSIRKFSTKDQLSIAKLKRATILPAMEWLMSDEITPDKLLSRIRPDAEKIMSKRQLEELSARIALDRHFPGEIWFAPIFQPSPISPVDFFRTENPITIAIEPEILLDEIAQFFHQANELYRRVIWEEFVPLPPDMVFDEPRKYENFIQDARLKVREIPVDENTLVFGAKEINVPASAQQILETIQNANERGEIFITISSENQKKRIEHKLGGKLPVPTRHGIISESFSIDTEDAEITVLSGDNILGFSRTMFVSGRYHSGRAIISHYGIEQGDIVVHSEYGMAKFLGIKTMNIKGHRSEFLELQFSGDEKLYVPMENFYLVNPYIGPRAMVRLSKLGGKKWSSAKSRARKKVFELAGELIRIYAMRETQERPPFPPAPEWERLVENSFSFKETPDQKQAINDVLSDMESAHPMDRLICGDVGFGKTEVAIRSAIRAIVAGKQVAVLVPTTILCAQHFDTFTERLSELPINIEMLCRFTPTKKVQQIKQNLARGKIDLVVGTHMLLSDTVRFKKLGLLIIDEEQWFGVKHKEKLKSLRAEVDVLTMTATPIPRTLYFSISGLRDLSIIETPPQARMPVFTQIVQWNMSLFSKTIYEELERDGQVFFIHNRVESIDGVTIALKKAMPDVRFAVAHGQIPKRELEKIIFDFRQGKYDVLVCTAIIESGTDMPNVNTIIINRADKFGLAQLYQLRGRVGRSNVQAYAYLVIPPYRTMTKNARKRLRALLEHSELGSGYHLAMKDMEIRGAGNLLGKEQSGFVAEIGLDLYSKMLAQAVAEIKGQKPPIFRPIPFNIDFDAFIPAEYIHNTENRIWAYQRLFTADKVEKIEQIAEELKDRFGKFPTETDNLIQFLKARILATQVGFQSVSFAKKWISIIFDSDKISLAELDNKLRKFEPPLDVYSSTNPIIRLPRTHTVHNDLMNLIRLFDKIAI